MTKKLFYEDSRMTEFEARVELCRKEKEHFEVVLDRTAFFPEGGGQYSDTGFLGDVRVTDVQEKDGVIYHITEEGVEEGHNVTGKIDWELRFMKMQQHTGEHIVSGLVHSRLGWNNVGFHLGNRDSTMDFNGEISKEQLREIESLANDAVAKNLEVLVTYPSGEALEKLEYRSKIEIEGQVRIVTIPGYDTCACCAPHAERTGEIGMIKLTDVQRYKGGVRVTMLCGFRALADYNEKEEQVKNISSLLCAKEDEVFQAAEYLKEEKNRLKAALAETRERLLEYKAGEVPEERFVCLFEEDLYGDEPRLLMNRVLTRGKDGCIVFAKNGDLGFRYVIGAKEMDVRPFAKGLNAQFDGRGGGKPEMVQGFLKGKEDVIRAWVQKKAEEIDYE